ncbi:MAG: flagellar export chaperone FliS [Planctomycetota bacterium]|jgi:flagellar protein FliS
MASPQAQPVNAYLKTKVMTAGSAELRLMLFDGAIRFAEQGREGLAQKDYEAAWNGISRTQEILIELISSLQPEQAPDLCSKLSGLYTFMYRRMVEASTEKDPDIVEEVLKLLRYERETWAMLLERLAEENHSAGQLQDTPTAEPRGPNDGDGPETGLIGGSVSVNG